MAISITPFVEAFVLLIVLPMALAVLTSAGARRSRAVATWNDATWAWCRAMALVLMVVIASQIAVVLRDFDRLLPVVPVYIGFMLAPVLGFICARLLLPAQPGTLGDLPAQPRATRWWCCRWRWRCAKRCAGWRQRR